MKPKEVKYYNFDGSLVREKLMVRRIVDGKETIEEADFHCLAGNIEELYFLAMRGKRISSGDAVFGPRLDAAFVNSH